MKLIMINRLSPCNSPQTKDKEHLDILVKAIDLMGLMNPLLVIRDKTRWFWRIWPHRYIVVSGNLRLKALIKLGYYAASCNIVEANSQLYYYESHP